MAILPLIRADFTPNQSERVHGNGAAVDLIECHTPEGSFQSARNTCHDTTRPPADRVSYHVIISEDGAEAIQLVPWHRKAWHGGTFNSRSEGIALAGFADRTFPLSPGGRAFARVVAARLRARRLPPRWRARGGVGGGYMRHADVQANRRDPMSLARWTTFRGLVSWEYHRAGFRQRWGFGEPDEIPD